MATQAATASWLVRAFSGVTAAQSAPPADSYKHPAKGQYNIPGRLAGWEDSSKVRFTTSLPTLGGTVTGCEITITRRLNATSDPDVVDKIKLVNGQFEPTKALPIAPGSYSCFISSLTGTAPNVTVKVYLQGLNEDFL